MSNYEGRHIDLKKRVNRHLSKLTGREFDYFAQMGQSDLIELKTVLADINNVLTFKMTIEAANWLCKFFKLNTKEKREILKKVDQTKPNSKGFDLHITEPYKIVAEVKCVSPVNNGTKFGSAQWNGILDDFYGLKNGKATLKDTAAYYKFLFLADLGDRTDLAIAHLLRTSKGTSEKPIRRNRHQIKEHISLLEKKQKFTSLNVDMIYLKKLRIR